MIAYRQHWVSLRIFGAESTRLGVPIQKIPQVQEEAMQRSETRGTACEVPLPVFAPAAAEGRQRRQTVMTC